MRRRWRKKAIYQESAWADHLRQRFQAHKRADRQIRSHLRLAAADSAETPTWTTEEVRRRGAGPVVVRDLWAGTDSNIVKVLDPHSKSHLRKMQRELGAFISPALRQRILERDEERCRYCGRPTDKVSTIRPRAEGGLLRHFNLVSCCGAHLRHDSRPTLRPVGWFDTSKRRSERKIVTNNAATMATLPPPPDEDEAREPCLVVVRRWTGEREMSVVLGGKASVAAAARGP